MRAIDIKQIFDRAFVVLDPKECPGLHDFYLRLAAADQQQLLLKVVGHRGIDLPENPLRSLEKQRSPTFSGFVFWRIGKRLGQGVGFYKHNSGYYRHVFGRNVILK